MTKETTLTEENFLHSYLRFNDRQAGVSLLYCEEKKSYYYNSYCVESKLLKELFSVEHDFLCDAIDLVNQEFGTWELVTIEEKKSGCSSCHAK